MAVAQHSHSFGAAIGGVDPYRRRTKPDLAIALDRRSQRVPDTDRALGAEAEAFECTLTGEIGQERAGWQFVSIAGKNRRAKIAENRVNRGVVRIAL